MGNSGDLQNNLTMEYIKEILMEWKPKENNKENNTTWIFFLLAKFDYEQIEIQCLVVVHPLVGLPTENG